MSSTISPNPGTASLLQILSAAGSPLVSGGAFSPNVQSALQNASPGDFVQLSAQALQLQESEGLFSTTPSASADPGAALDNLLAALNPISAGSASSASTSSGTLSPSQLASYQNLAQLEQIQTLFGTGTSVNVLA